jgi:type IV pilus assembly protein PilC
MARQSQNPRLREVLQNLQAKVESGETLSAAFASYPRIFDPVIVNLVRAGEASGTLAKMLERIADQARQDIETRGQMFSALTYPIAMLSICTGLCIFLLVYVFPKITPMFVARGLKLPTPTLAMLTMSDALRFQGHWIGLAVVSCAAGAVWLLKFPTVRKLADGTLLRLPILGKVIAKVTLCRILRTLASTLNAGVPMLESIRLCAAVAKNVHFQEIWERAAERVSTGQQVHTALENSTLIPASLLQMIASGEQSGKLGHVLNRVSDYYDREVALAFKSAMGVMEPILITCMGSIIGFIALSMMLPIFKLGSHIG